MIIYIHSQKAPVVVRSEGFDDGLQLFELVDGCNLQYVINSRIPEPIPLHFVDSNEAYSHDMISSLFANVGNASEIALAYELLITAYRSMEHYDFRSAVILRGVV